MGQSVHRTASVVMFPIAQPDRVGGALVYTRSGVRLGPLLKSCEWRMRPES